MPEPIIRAEAISRSFKETKAVADLDLTIQSGELFGLVGPDGAGKTTTLRLLAGLLRADEGAARVAGFDLLSQPESVKPRIGYMAQQFSLYAELTVEENLAFFAEIYDVDRSVLVERKASLLAFAGLTDFKSRRAGHLSGGMQKKLALACTLIHQPDILLLDEPTTGVDPISRREFWNILTDLHLRGTTIICSTPYMDEADRCSRVGLMYAGKLIACDSPREIRRLVEGQWIELQPADALKAGDLVRVLPGVLEVQTSGRLLQVRVDSSKRRSPEIKRVLREHGIAFSGIRQTQTRMEQAFISLIRQVEGA